MRSLLRFAFCAACLSSVVAGMPSSTPPSSAVARAMTPRIAYAAERLDNTPVSRCIDTTKTETESGFDLEFNNDCDTAVACAVRWTVTCENSKGKRSVAGAQNVRLGKSEKSTVRASAAVCGNDSWEISDPIWKCDPAGG